MSAPLFEPDVPPGLLYHAALIDVAEEAELLNHIRQIAFSNYEMRGVVARRRVAYFGHTYEGTAGAKPMPEFLHPLRARIADWVHVEPAAFAMGLIIEYPPGAPIGWHRDAPHYDLVAGVSLLSSCVMRFRPYVSPAAKPSKTRRATHEITLDRRSSYLLSGAARSDYEHHIPAVNGLRYSITFRTLRL